MDRQRSGCMSLLRDFLSLTLCVVMAPGPELLGAGALPPLPAPGHGSVMLAAALKPGADVSTGAEVPALATGVNPAAAPSAATPAGGPLFQYGAFSTSTTCGAITLTGSSFTDSFDSSQGSYASTRQKSGGNIGANGNISLRGNVNVYGTASSPQSGTGACESQSLPAVTSKGNATISGGIVLLATQMTYDRPPAPSPAPPTLKQSISGRCGNIPGCSPLSGSKNLSLAPGGYGDLTVSGGTAIHLQAGTYNINALALSGNSELIADSTPVLLNFAGQGLSADDTVLDLVGGSISNPSSRPGGFEILYAGAAYIKLTGGVGSYGLVYAPSARVVLGGGADWYGAIIASTLTDTGNSAIHYDRALGNALPTITANPDPPPNAAGWNNTNVTVTFSCSGTLVIACSDPVSITTEGANQQVTGTVRDMVGNTASVRLAINLDKTPPAVTASAFPLANAAGWNNTNVTVSFAGNDTLSGVVVCTAPTTLSSEARNQSASGTCADGAGNVSPPVMVTGINIDKTAPTLTFGGATPAADADGWNKTNVSFPFTTADNLSGVASTSVPSPLVLSTEGVSVNGTVTVTDVAGNSANFASPSVKIDKTPPSIIAAALPLPNAAGWNNSNVTVSFQCGDSLSGVADCPAPIEVSTEGANQVISGSVSDRAGNTALTSVKLNIDKAPPNITASASPPPNSAGWNNSDVTVGFNCSDSLSGIASCPLPVQITADGSNQPVTGTTMDNAGNSSTASLNISLEKNPPSVSITSPVSGAVLPGSTVNVTGTVVALSGIVSVSCNGAAGTISGSTYSCIVPLSPGSNTITVQATDVAGNTGSNSETVTTEAPLLSLNPNSGLQGQRNLTVALRGQSTHWVEGTTTTAFGAGIIASVSVSSPTVATAVINIDPAAVPGPREVSLTTTNEIASLANGFTVLRAIPLLLQVSPPTGQQGQQSVTVGLTGQFTNWTQGRTIADFGSGISVLSVTVTSPTSAIAVLNISAEAAPGARRVTATTSGEVAALDNGFTVLVTAALSSCLPSGSLGVLLPPKGTGKITAYVPNGAWASGNLTGIQVVPIEGGGEATSIPTPFWVSSCASNSVTGETVCVADHTDVYLITGTSLNTTLKSGADVQSDFSGGQCATCGVAINGLTNTAVLQLGAFGPSYSGLQFLDLATNTFSSVFPLTYQVSEDIQWDQTRNLIVSPGELLPGSSLNGGFYDLIDTSAAVPKEFAMDLAPFNPPGKQFDAGAEDCTTGIAMSTIENTSQLFITDLTQASFRDGSPGSWTAPGQFVNFPEFAKFHDGTSGIAVPPGSHLAAVTGEFGGNQFGVVVLPSTSGSGTPAFGDYVAAALPPTPDGVAWSQGLDPHTISAYVSPNTGKAMAIFANAPDQGILYSFATSPPSWLALIDLQALLAAPRKADVFPSGEICPGCTHSVDPNYDLLAHGVVRYIGTGPEILGICPNRVQTGLQNLSVNLTGRTTHWTQGVTTANFGPGITVVSLNVTSPTSATAVINIDPFPEGGPRIVTMTTGSEVETFASGFNFTAVGLERAAATQGQQNLVVPLVGINTNWRQELTTADFGPGITVLSLTVDSPISATAIVNISATAPSGPRSVTLRTGDCEVDTTAAGGFYVFEGTPALAAVSPNAGRQGQQNLAVTLTGQFTHWVQGTTIASFGDITVSSLTINSPTRATAILNINAGLFVGFRSVSMTTGSDAVYSTFTVTAGTPSLVSVKPNVGQQGQQNLSVGLVGQFTNWLFGATTASFGPGINVASLTVSSGTNATAVLNIDATAAIGTRAVTLKAGSEIATLSDGFAVTAGTPSLISVNPYAGQQGQHDLSLLLTGQLTNWAQGSSTANFGQGITVTSLTVMSSTSATAIINIDPDANTGPRAVTMTTGVEVETLGNGLTVTPSPPVRLSLNPNSGQQNQQNLSIAITGLNTHFAQGGSRVDFGAGVAVGSISVNSATSLTAQITIAANATPGLRTVSVTTGGEYASLDNGFTVVRTSTPPGLQSVSPVSGLQGQTLSVLITGQNTNLVQGQTMARFGPGVMVGTGIVGNFAPVTVTSPTTATAQITILNSAMPGLRTVTLQTGSEQEILADSFQVVGRPMFLGTSPSSANPGQSLSVRIGFAFTNFVQGVTQVSFGPGVSVGGGPVGGFGPVTVINAGSVMAQVTIDSGAKLGPHTIVAQTGTEQASADIGFNVLGPVTGPPPEVAFTGIEEATEIRAPTAITGSITSPNLDTWTLAYQPAGATSFTNFASGTTSTVSGTFDPTLLRNGNVTIRLSAIDTAGQAAAPATITVVVTKNLKLGNFSLSFRDLTIPVAGLPIQVMRTYDSRDKEPGDFGTGWKLGLKSVTLSKNFAEGNQWSGSRSPDFFPTFCIAPSKPHVVTVAFPEGTTYEFRPAVDPGCQLLQPPDVVTVTYTAINDTPPNASLAIAGDNHALVGGDFLGSLMLLDFDSLGVFDPDQYALTLPDGRVLLISRQAGLQTVTDLNGNTLSFGPTGITSSNGKSVSFTRDAQDRITQVTDPAGNSLTYSYDANGDLVSDTDQLKNTRTYTYDSNHNLLGFQDPRGVQPIRNDYDANGRLVSTTDAFGHVINFVHDLNARQEIVTDRLGNTTVHEYDSDGNVVKEIDALGRVTTRTFDSRGNKLNETDALGQTTSYTYDANNNELTHTDPLGNTRTYIYNSMNQPVVMTDPLQRVIASTYDAFGNLVSSQDSAGNVSTHTYDSAGRRTSTTDPLGGVTSFQYDSSGNLTQQTDAMGNATTFTYDANSNRLSETRTRTTTSGQERLVTSYQYDAQNRLIQTTYPDGSTTQVQYNLIGRQSLAIDQLGRQTSYQYDSLGKLVQISYADGAREVFAYDAEGNRITSTDRAGRTTTYVYDSLNRLVQTIYPDSTSTSTTYDGGGHVIAVTDARGNQTQYQYDAVGRQTKVIDALGHATSFGYDAVGNKTSITDANGHTTQYVYDTLNHRTAVIYPDSTTDVTTWDAMGRITGKTDQAGKTTQFQYDKLGRVVQVTDALGQVTRHGYDEEGRRISQTDANGHTTTFAYDEMGRRTQRTLPLGMSEIYSYDLGGNLTSKTDFNGRTTTYIYDELRRITSKVPDPSFSTSAVAFTYTPTGRRLSMRDASGTTLYSYDLRDRLIEKATPAGTLFYAYDGAGNLTSIQSSNPGGTAVNYTYDRVNRLDTARDGHSGSSTYSYDNVGNLQGYLYPNGVRTTYAYDTLNRLTSETVNGNSTQSLARYVYTLEPAGNRIALSELSGRQVSYTYDALTRLTNELVNGSSDATTNGSIGYRYDAVGNRLQRVSTIGAIPAANYSYDANDRLTADNYDSNGNTVASGGHSSTYDFENRLTSFNGGAVIIVYDGDGNRVAETVNGVTTQYLVDDRNLTRYAQVLEELSGGAVQRVYAYGLSRISQTQAGGTSFYGYDGHGDIRFLTDATGVLTDRYDYDSFGNLVTKAGPTPNNYLFAGEQYDPALGLYYNRARYLNTATGRFWTMDAHEGDPQSPLSLHKYLYAGANSVNRVDPSGNEFDSVSIAISITISVILGVGIGYAAGYGISHQGSAYAQVAGELAVPYASQLATAALDEVRYHRTETGILTKYQKWFDPIYPADDARATYVSQGYEKIIAALNQPIRFYITNKYDPGFDPEEYAHSFSNNSLEIWLGPRYFTCDVIGQNSQAGTIVHELSHILFDTDDFEYGEIKSQLLAITNPAQAIHNADNYEGFAEAAAGFN